jgi:hypothetical protein
MDKSGDESVPREGNGKRSIEEELPREDEGIGSDGSKRARGPYDCLNWESDDEEFTPFTQSSSPPKEVFAKKSTPKSLKKKNVAKNRCSKKSASSKVKGKSLGKALVFICLLCCFNWCFIEFVLIVGYILVAATVNQFEAGKSGNESGLGTSLNEDGGIDVVG